LTGKGKKTKNTKKQKTKNKKQKILKNDALFHFPQQNVPIIYIRAAFSSPTPSFKNNGALLLSTNLRLLAVIIVIEGAITVIPVSGIVVVYDEVIGLVKNVLVRLEEYSCVLLVTPPRAGKEDEEPGVVGVAMEEVGVVRGIPGLGVRLYGDKGCC
jgi:hypothetical protein